MEKKKYFLVNEHNRLTCVVKEKEEKLNGLRKTLANIQHSNSSQHANSDNALKQVGVHPETQVQTLISLQLFYECTPKTITVEYRSLTMGTALKVYSMMYQHSNVFIVEKIFPGLGRNIDSVTSVHVVMKVTDRQLRQLKKSKNDRIKC